MKSPTVRFLLLGDPTTDRRSINFIRFFSELGFETEFVFASPNNNGASPLLNGTRLTLHHSSGPLMFIEYEKILTEFLADAPPCDILFSSELYSLKSAAKAIKAKKAGYLIYDARELYTELPTVANNLFKKLFWKRWEKFGLKNTNLMVVTAPDDAGAIQSVHGSVPDHICIRNLPALEIYEANNYLRNKFSISDTKKVLVYLGGVQTDRGLEKMISAMSVLSDVASFVIIGDGILKNIFQKEVKNLGLEDAVFFHDTIPAEDSISMLSSADVGISLIEAKSKSYELALPSKIFEYMLAGLPIVSSPLRQVKALLGDSEFITYTNPNGVNSVVEACRIAIAHSSDPKLKERIHQTATDNFTFEHDRRFLLDKMSAIPNLLPTGR
ncbi:MAG: glycosyltransferase [bacterium]